MLADQPPTPGRAWIATGDRIEVPGQVDRIPTFDPRSGAHLWIIATCFRVDPARFADTTATPMLDGENLLTITPPGCYYCEQVWTKLLATRRCTGEPRA